MEPSISTVEELFEALGGPAAFGRAVGISTEHASVIKQRRSIPLSRWPLLLESDAARSIGVTSDLLVKIHANEAQP